MGTTRTLLTFEEFEQLPDEPGKSELLHGELFQLPPAESRHTKFSHRILYRLNAALQAAHARGEGLELGETFLEMGYRLSGQTWLQPDVSLTYSNQAEEKYLMGSPAIAIEVVSPSNTRPRLERKAALYLENGAREVWHFYPKQRQLVVITIQGRTPLSDSDVLTTPLLPGFAAPVAELLA